MTFFADRRIGELASRLSADLIQIEDTLVTLPPQFLREVTLLIGGIALDIWKQGWTGVDVL